MDFGAFITLIGALVATIWSMMRSDKKAQDAAIEHVRQVKADKAAVEDNDKRFEKEIDRLRQDHERVIDKVENRFEKELSAMESRLGEKIDLILEILKRAIMSTMLSEHFSLEELTATSTGFPNIPDAKSLENLKLLAMTLERIRTVLNKPISISSGYRSTKVNTAVKGMGNSYHLYGCAADIKVKGMTPYEVCIAIKDSGIEFDQLILEELGGNGGWTHIGIKENNIGNRKQCLTIRKGTGYMNGIIQ